MQEYEEEAEVFEMQTHARRKAAGSGLTADERASHAEAQRRAAAERQAAREAAGAIHVPYDPAAVLCRAKAAALLYVRALQGLVQVG